MDSTVNWLKTKKLSPPKRKADLPDFNRPRARIRTLTHGSTQNITLSNTNNPDFDRALASLVELTRSSQIPDDDKQELEEEVGKVNKLALREPAPGLLEKAKSRLDMIKLAVTGTDIAMKAAPHINTLWELLQQRFGGN